MKNLLDNAEKSYGKNSGASIVGAIIGLVVGIVLSVAVAIPICNDVITNGNFTGTTKTVLDIVPVMVAIVPIVLVSTLYG
jgi:ABC-type nitrate/sulfonate/bicarbonate transport system permease component